MAHSDVNRLLERLRELTARLTTTWPSPDAVAEMTSAFTQLDGDLHSGGILPRDWMPPMMNNSEGHLLSVERAERRLRSVLDRAIRDNERADRAFAPDTPAVAGAAAEFREYLIKLLARAVIRELEEEQRQVQAMLARLARDQTVRIAEEVARLERQPPAVVRPTLPGSLRRPPS